jgi:hypothetical protein
VSQSSFQLTGGRLGQASVGVIAVWCAASPAALVMLTGVDNTAAAINSPSPSHVFFIFQVLQHE